MEAHKIRVANRAGEEIIEAKQIIIATGSRPRRPDSIPIDDRIIVDSDSLLDLDTLPKSLTIIGTGVIGCEYATIFGALGTKVTIIDRRKKLLRFLDTDILDTLCNSMRNSGIRVMQRRRSAESVLKIRIAIAKTSSTSSVAVRFARNVYWPLRVAYRTSRPSISIELAFPPIKPA